MEKTLAGSINGMRYITTTNQMDINICNSFFATKAAVKIFT
jgi:hypothetical protein